MHHDQLADPLALDTSHFESLADLQEDGQPDILGEMVSLFSSEVGRWLLEADAALRAQDAVALRRVAHSLKGVCGTVGADRMRQIAVDLEAALRAGFSTDVETAVIALNDEMRQVMTVLARYANR